ncbi:5-oxoprolinase subunit PxpB [Paenibacillus sp. N4]|uniref:5-oxoprolinase subunit PxpB n=1 Tax=Paenibacillus vietnamensis TaxID=2590547 RepID=UPI001CD12F7A|nr:5-oxoprolinase subunit PxpB [Paenibacillus vietnamensis]MCA0758698.1 5-oxoprolinase subunit PxpB [Paenibacillus vietnamensis]
MTKSAYDQGREGYPRLSPLGDSAVLVSLGSAIDEETHRRVTAAAAWLKARPFPGLRECVPSYAAVAVHYDPLAVKLSRSGAELRHATVLETVCSRVERLLEEAQTDAGSAPAHGRTVDIPVCYGGEHGPDLSFVAAHNGISEDDVIAIHSGEAYLVYMLGFAPGFPYLGGMPERIAAPRRSTPRTVIPEGSVGIAGGQTGVYPLATPGGWQLIGRTPVKLFQPDAPSPSLLGPGDRVRFIPITSEQYKRYREVER